MLFTKHYNITGWAASGKYITLQKKSGVFQGKVNQINLCYPKQYRQTYMLYSYENSLSVMMDKSSLPYDPLDTWFLIESRCQLLPKIKKIYIYYYYTV